MNGLAARLFRLSKLTAFLFGLATLVASASTAGAQQALKAAPPVLVTSIGQSLDAFQVQLVVKRTGVAFKYDPHATEEQLTGVKTLFLCIGASLKGMGDAGIKINDELSRASRLLDAAKSQGIYVVVLHMGGTDRRDALTNQIIDVTASRAQKLIIRSDSDADGVFAEIAKASNIPLIVVENAAALKQPLQDMFAGA